MRGHLRQIRLDAAHRHGPLRVPRLLWFGVAAVRESAADRGQLSLAPSGLARKRHSQPAEAAYNRLLAIADKTMLYNEYYGSDDRVRTPCCRARTWESGMNAESIINYLLRPHDSACSR